MMRCIKYVNDWCRSPSSTILFSLLILFLEMEAGAFLWRSSSVPVCPPRRHVVVVVSAGSQTEWLHVVEANQFNDSIGPKRGSGHHETPKKLNAERIARHHHHLLGSSFCPPLLHDGRKNERKVIIVPQLPTTNPKWPNRRTSMTGRF
jgi:hypothetical protein